MRTLPLILVLSACSPVVATLRSPDPSRAGEDGTEGPFGAATARLAITTRVTDVRGLDVVYPSTSEGTPDLSGAPWPIVVMLHGGFVDRARYTWLGAHLATRGYVTLLPEHEAQLAILEPGNGDLALQAVRRWSADPGHPLAGLTDTTAPVAVAGHSLGGVMAARQWLLDDTIAGLVMIASVTNPSDTIEEAPPRPVLSLVGSEDGYLDPLDVVQDAPRFPSPPWIGVVDGMTHIDWTDDATARELAADKPATRPQGSTRRDAQRVLDAWLDAVLVEGATTFDGVFSGVEEVEP